MIMNIDRDEKDIKKRAIRLIIAGTVLILLTAAFTESAGRGAEDAMINDFEGIIRFHVVANSDSQQDQQLKMMVRNWLLVRLQNSLEGKESTEETRQYIKTHLSEISAWAQDCTEAYGCDYPVRATFGVKAIPARQYDDIYFPAGNYEALTVTIGEGAGQNWWCVVFPPLCLVDCSEGQYEELTLQDEGGRLILKSKLREILEKNKKKSSKKRSE